MRGIKKDTKGLKAIPQKFSVYIGLGVIIMLIMSLWSNISRMKSVNLKIEKEKEKVEKIKKENEELQKDLEFVQSGEYIEKQLRENLGMAKEDEVVVILPEEEIVKKFAPRIDEEEEIPLEPNWKKWMQLFGF
jgi:cell division protein FtsB